MDAERFLAEGGLWQTWTAQTRGNPDDPHDRRGLIEDLCTLAIEAAEGA
jgi:hypothetical protein